MRILVADDESSIRLLVSAVLNTLDAEIIAVADGAQALQVMEEDDFDLIISDIRMPNVDGITLLHRVKEETPELPVLMISAHSDVCDQAVQEGADGCLPKPFSFHQLLQAVKPFIQVE